MSKIVTIGELMLRLSTINNNRFVQSKSFDACFGGSEANVAVSLSHFDNDAVFVSKLPNSEIGLAAIKSLKAEGVNTKYILKDDNRIGLYYLENGNSLRTSKVIYDRKNSSMSLANVNDFDFKKIFEGASLFHFSGITPALSLDCAKITLHACKVAKEMGLLVSCDFNYRSKLWTLQQAKEVMLPLMEYVDIFIGSKYDIINCLGFNPKADNEEEIYKEIAKHFSFKYIASTKRDIINASHNKLSGFLFNGTKLFVSTEYDIHPIIDRVGTGDAFTAGIIHGILNYESAQKTIDFATASCALKHSIPGDYNQVSEKEIFSLIDSGVGRIIR